MPSDPEDPRELHPGALLYRASHLHNLPLMAEALAHGADVHAASEEEEGKTPLIQAVMGVRESRWCNPTPPVIHGHIIITLPPYHMKELHVPNSKCFKTLKWSIIYLCQGSLIACEFLLQNGADVNQRDMRGRGPLHHATYLGRTGWETSSECASDDSVVVYNRNKSAGKVSAKRSEVSWFSPGLWQVPGFRQAVCILVG